MYVGKPQSHVTHYLTPRLISLVSWVREVLKLNIRTSASPRPRVTRTNFSIGAIDG